MPYAERIYFCAGCGDPVAKRGSKSAEVRCITCAIERSVENMHQLRNRRGAFYDKWAANLAAAMDGEVRHSRANEVAERRG